MINEAINKDEEKKEYPHMKINKVGHYLIYIEEGKKIGFDSSKDLKKFIEENELPIYIKE